MNPSIQYGALVIMLIVHIGKRSKRVTLHKQHGLTYQEAIEVATEFVKGNNTPGVYCDWQPESVTIHAR